MNRERAKFLSIGVSTKVWWARELTGRLMSKYPNLNRAKVLLEVTGMMTDIAVDNLNACRKESVSAMEDAFVKAFYMRSDRIRRCV